MTTKPLHPSSLVNHSSEIVKVEYLTVSHNTSHWFSAGSTSYFFLHHTPSVLEVMHTSDDDDDNTLKKYPLKMLATASHF